MDGSIDLAPPTTLDEPVLTTITRDLTSVYTKLKVVLRPSTFSSMTAVSSFFILVDAAAAFVGSVGVANIRVVYKARAPPVIGHRGATRFGARASSRAH